MKKIIYFGIFLFMVLFALSAGAKDVENKPVWMTNQPVNDYSVVSSAYRTVNDLNFINIIVPTVVELPISLNLNQRKEAVVYDVTDKEFVASYLKYTQVDNSVKYSVVSGGVSQSGLGDRDYTSCTDFDLQSNSSISYANLVFNYDKEITSDTLYLSLDNYVTLPVSLSITAIVNGAEKIVLAQTKINSSSISFPKVTSKVWTVNMAYAQPLRICEASFRQANISEKSSYAVRFLAEKDHQYQIFFDGDRSVNISYPEAPNLTNDFGVLKLSAVTDKINSLFKLSDLDKDGVPDMTDNCVSVANADQADLDKNGRGDVCDDFDRDGIINSKDNCLNSPNYNQADTDADGIGDTCDTTEGRITERYTWLPWLGIGLAGIIVIGLFIFTAMSMRKKTDLPTQN